MPVTRVELAEIARGEAAEIFQRKDFTHSEAVAIKEALEPEIKAAAKERMISAHASGGKLPQLLQLPNLNPRSSENSSTSEISVNTH